MKRIDAVTTEQWDQVCEFNRNLCEEFLENSTELSKETIKSYKSCLRIWFNWLRENMNNIRHVDVKARDYLRFQNWLVNLGHSSCDISNKRASISSLNNYVVLYYDDMYPTFRNFISKAVKRPEKASVYEKIPLTKAEFAHLIEELTKMERWQEVAYLQFSHASGCRISEAWALLKEVVNYSPIINTVTTKDEDGNDITKESKYYCTHNVRCKGKGKSGVVRKLKFTQSAMDAIKKWLEIRGEDNCPYVFVYKDSKQVRQIAKCTINIWCSGLFSDIVGRRVHPHLLRESQATSMVIEEGLSPEKAQKLLGHKSVQTTNDFYIIRGDVDNIDDVFIDD